MEANASLSPSTVADLEQSVFVLACLTYQSCAGARPQQPSHWFCTQNLLSLDCLLGQPSKITARWQAGAQIWTLLPHQRVRKVYLLRKYKINSMDYYRVWNFLGLLKIPKIETSGVWFLRLTPSTAQCLWHSGCAVARLGSVWVP